jgi:hypothetical protein
MKRLLLLITLLWIFGACVAALVSLLVYPQPASATVGSGGGGGDLGSSGGSGGSGVGLNIRSPSKDPHRPEMQAFLAQQRRLVQFDQLSTEHFCSTYGLLLQDLQAFPDAYPAYGPEDVPDDMAAPPQPDRHDLLRVIEVLLTEHHLPCPVAPTLRDGERH